MAAPASPWARVQQTPVATNLRDVLSEQLAEQLQIEEHAEIVVKATPATPQPAPEAHIEASTSNASCETYSEHVDPNQVESGDSDLLLAKLLQEQFDAEYDESLRLQERHLNKNSKIAISLENYKLTSRAERQLLTADDAETASLESSSGEDEPPPNFNRKGICVQGDKIITKHDADVNSKLNVARMNSFTLAMNTGDSHTFESTRLNNRVFNQLKTASYAIAKRDERNHEKREEQATNVKAVDQRTRLLLFKLVNKGTLQSLDGVVATGKESVILHATALRRPRPYAKSSKKGREETENPEANEDTTDEDSENEQQTDVESVADTSANEDGFCECAVKVYKTTLTEFKTRAAYINGDPRFMRDEFKKQNPRKIIRIWAEKEFINLRKMRQCGIHCPEAIELKKHCLLMTFIGANRIAAPCLRSVELTLDEWRTAYNQLCDTLCVMYTQAGLVHGDLSEYNLLWHANRVWIIDVSQSVDRTHPQSWPFLLRDIRNITRFFASRGLKLKRNVKTNDSDNAEISSANEQESTIEGDLDSVEVLFNKVTEANLEGEGETWMKAFANYVANARQYKRVTSMLHYGGDSTSTDWREVDADAEDDLEEEIWQFIQTTKESQK